MPIIRTTEGHEKIPSEDTFFFLEVKADSCPHDTE